MTTHWHGCYADNWNGIITPDAFAHPAKFARGLIRRIYSHMMERGYIAIGDSVIDPFGGIAAGAYDALLFGLHWTGCELEPRFVELGNANIDKYRHDLRMLNGRLGTARLLQGDSRRLGEVVESQMAASRCSPPYSETHVADGEAAALAAAGKARLIPDGASSNGVRYGSTPGQLGSMRSGDFAAAVSSPPFGEALTHGTPIVYANGDRIQDRAYSPENQGDSPGNLAALRADDSGFAAAVSSPPFGDQLPSHDDFQPPHDSTARLNVNYETAHGNEPGHLGTMKPGDFAASISSPPYADAVNGTGEGPGARHDPVYHNGDNAFKQSSANGYGVEAGNLGNMAGEGFEAAVNDAIDRIVGVGAEPTFTNIVSLMAAELQRGRDFDAEPTPPQPDTGETFWSAARQIVEQTYAVLKPGGYAVWVCKDFVRKGQRVPFSDQWEQLCAAVGFIPVERIHAMLVEERGEQLDIFGGVTVKRVERKSFFRRLAEKKGSPRIDHEDVIIMRKPL